jgi:hypothetical protein
LADVIIKKMNEDDFRFVFVLKGVLYSVGLKKLEDKWTFYMIEKAVKNQQDTIESIFDYLLQHKDVTAIFENLGVNKETIQLRILNKGESNNEFTFIFD